MNINAYLQAEKEDEMVICRNSLILTPGLWVNGKVYWLDDASEKLIPIEELSIKIRQPNIHSKVEFFDIFVTNHSKNSRDAKLILMQQYMETANDQFSFVSPNEDVIFHFADKRIYLVNGMNSTGRMKQCTVQPIWNLSTERLWACRESGVLSYQPMAKGAAASLFSLDLKMGPRETQKSSCWSIEGTEKNTVINLNHMLLKNTLAFPDKK
ncbi:hypothetical protein V7654_14425 [Bacillus sp. JJ1609]|uniref:hypothetical protein n=1 Tax=Bacillus sp. JJ1609 TaxID=3122977 RepID=UPI002FFF035F